MSEKDVEIVNTKIEESKNFLNSVSRDIWKMPEVRFKEVQAHAVLTCALRRSGFRVQKHYFMPTAFRSDFSCKNAEGPTIAVLLEYDALPEIGHACGHNLIAEAGLAAAIAIKAAMESDDTIFGKLVVLGTPGEEGGGGKIRLLELGAFDGVDIALMVHPASVFASKPLMLCNKRYEVQFKGKAAHAAAHPWLGKNALDAAVLCYQNLAQLKQHIKSTCRVQAIIKKGGVAANVIPAESSLDIHVRAPTKCELSKLTARVEACITSAAAATGCEVTFRSDDAYENMITNAVLADIFVDNIKRFGITADMNAYNHIPTGSSDMGNVSHNVPAIHPLFQIPSQGICHSPEFTRAAGSPEAQKNTLLVSKAMALTALRIMRSPEILEKARQQFERDIKEEDKD